MQKYYLFVLVTLFFSVTQAQNVGVGTNDPKSKLDINGGLSLREGPVLTLANGGAQGGANDNIVLPDISAGVKAGFYRIAGPTGAFSVFGVVPNAGADGQLITLVNTTSNVMTIKNNASSQAANSFKTLTGSDMVSVAGSSSVTLQYNKTDSRWYVTGSQNYVVTTGSISTGDITTGNNAILMTNNTGRLVGTAAMTLDVKTNDLNQKGIVPGPTGGNNNQVWGTDNSGFPAWQKVNNTMLTNNSVTVSPGAGMSGGGTVALGGTITLTNTGDLNGSDDINVGAAAGGDLTGTYPNPTVAKIRGTAVSTTGPSNGQVLKYNSGSTQWEPAADNNGGGTVTAVTASNGLNSSGGNTPDIKLGGALLSNTDVPLSSKNLAFSGAGNVSVGTTATPGTLTVNGTSVIGSGLTSRAAIGATISSNDAFAYAGNADIGDAHRAFSIVNENTTANNMVTLAMRTNAGGAGNQMLDMKLVSATGGIGKLIYSFGPAAVFTDRFTMTSDGNLGVGVTSPLARLHVRGGKTYLNQLGNDPAAGYAGADLVLGDNTTTRNGYTGTNGSHIFLQSSDKSTITALDESDNLGQIAYQNLKWTLGEDIGWGTQQIKIPNLAGSGNRAVFADPSGILTTSGGGSSVGGATVVPIATYSGEPVVNSTSWQRVTRTTYSSLASLFSGVPVASGATRKYYLVIRRADNQPGGTGSFWRIACDGGWNGGNDVPGHGFSISSNWGSPSEGTTDWVEIPPTAVSGSGAGTQYWKIDARMANAGQTMRVMSVDAAVIDVPGGTNVAYSVATSGNATNPSLSTMYENIWSTAPGGNVGVGISTPQHQLTVGVNTGDAQLVTIRGYSNSPASWKGGAAFGYTSASVIMGELGSIAQIGGHSATLNAWAPLAINAGGSNIGLGTSTINNRVQLQSDNSSQALQFNHSSYIGANQWGTRTYKSDIGGGIPLKLETQSASTWYGSADFDHGQDNGHPSLKTYYNTQLAVSGGNVGIGTTGPGKKLDVQGGVSLGAGTYQSGAVVDIGSTSVDYPANSGWASTYNTNLLLSGLDYTTISFHDAGQTVGDLGHVGNTFFFDGGSSWGPISLGLNTRAPSATLDVNGGARVRALGAGYVKSDGSGNLSSGAIAAADLSAAISGTTNYVPRFTSANSIGNGIMYDNGTAIGIGTTSPAGKFQVAGTFAGGVMVDGNDRPSMAASGSYPQMVLMAGGTGNTSHGATVMLGSFDAGTSGNHKHWSIGTAGNGSTFLDIGYHGGTDLNPHAGIRNYNGSTFMTIQNSGNVGIGTLNPVDKLDVAGGVQIGTGNFVHRLVHGNNARLLLPAGNNGAGNGDVNFVWWASEPGMTWTGAGIARNMYNTTNWPRINGSLSGQMMRFDEGVGILFYTETSGGTRYTPMYLSGNDMVVNGNTGMGISNMGAKLTVRQGGTDPGSYDDGKALFVSGSFGSGQSYDGGIEFRHDNLSQGIGFGYNTIYQTGYNANQELNLIGKGSGAITLNAVGGASGNVGVGTSPSYKLHVEYSGGSSTIFGNNPNGSGIAVYANNPASASGTGWAMYGAGDVYCGGTYYGSDLRLKKNIENYTGAISDVMKLTPKKYNYDAARFPNAGFDDRTHYGFIAQELEEVFPSMVKEKKLAGIDAEGNQLFKTVDYISIIPVLTQAIKEQQLEIDQLKNGTGVSGSGKGNAPGKSEMDELKTQNRLLQEQLDILKAKMEKLEEKK